jgi:hypothetical protein
VTEDLACEVARWVAVAGGYDLASYDDPVASQTDGVWAAHFQGRSGSPGDHFLVVLDEETHRSRISAGR